MSFLEVAIRMAPYWFMGLMMIFMVWWSGNKDVIRIDKKSVFAFTKFMVIVTLVRYVTFKYLPHSDGFDEQIKSMTIIPWQAAFFVFWEDMCHTVPLFLLAKATDAWKIIPKRIVNFSALAIMMASFGFGHVYQGYLAAALLSLYIPFTLSKGKQLGFGTIMLCHIIYDLSTFLLIKYYLSGL